MVWYMMFLISWCRDIELSERHHWEGAGAGLDLPQRQPTQSNQVEWLFFMTNKYKQIREMLSVRLHIVSQISYVSHPVSNVNEN